MRLAELTGRRVALLGVGTDVRAAIGPIVEVGPAELIAVADSRSAELESQVLATVGGRVPVRWADLSAAAAESDVLVRSPGFPRSSSPIRAALGRGARMTTPVDLWLGAVGPEQQVIGVTGTKGKSTVTSLVGWFAERLGVRVGLAGNVGVPVFDPAWDSTAPIVVIEISSYQAADLHRVPDVAVLTFLAEDHLSWHGDRGAYDEAKLRVVRNEGGSAPVVLVGEAGGRWPEVLAGRGIGARTVVAPDAGPELPAHRVGNAALAAAALTAAGGPVVPGELVIEAARQTMPGRLDPCPGPTGLLCVDDALASNPAAAAAGLAWLRGLGRSTVVLIGGVDRSVDPAPLRDEVRRWPAGSLRAVALPDNGPALAAAVGLPGADVASDVASAVALAVAAAGPGGAVILSPGAPTPPAVGDWKVRSAQFRAALVAAT